MKKNPFRLPDGYDHKPNRVARDLSFQFNGTFKYGALYPVLAKPVIAGDSWSMTPTFALNLMPMTFPVQTRQRAYLHYFYVRNRNIWDDWEDFVGGTKQGLEPPYLSPASNEAWYDVFGNGSLGDYLGIPTTIVGNYGNSYAVNIIENQGVVSPIPYAGWNYCNQQSTGLAFDSFLSTSPTTRICVCTQSLNYTGQLKTLSINGINNIQNGSLTGIIIFDKNDHIGTMLTSSNYTTDIIGDNTLFTFNTSVDLSNVGRIAFYLISSSSSVSISTTGHVAGPVVITATGVYGISELSPSTAPWYSSLTPDKPIKIDADLFRAYEMIYNSFYRNSQNNPYILNGVAEYNKYIPTKDGGADNNNYKLRFRNWEDDFLTTAVQSPQQGQAPLVGLVNRDATVTLQDADGNVTRYTLTTNEDGSVNGVTANDSANPQLTQAMVDAVSYGISIQDFRNVNALQRWLEIQMRKGYKYSDVMQAHFGVNIRYNALDMPEFIGGTYKDIYINRVTQTNNQTDADGLPLGWQSGQGGCVGEGQSINYYFDEPGYVIAIMSVVPVPNYSQLLPKHFQRRDLLDYYFPEFAKIGFQPITYKEVCPAQAYADNPATLDETFGYNVPWYEYLSNVDEVHGDFRTSLKNFVLNRTFDVKPELSESFLLVDPEQLNDVFNYTENTDKIVGQIYHNITAKRPIPLYGIAHIE